MKTTTQKTAKRASPKAAGDTFSAEEVAAMKEHIRDTKARAGKGKVDGEAEIRAKIAAMKGDDRKMAERIHTIVKAAAPTLASTTWYGMPAYAREDGKIVCFFQDAAKFKARYATLGFSDKANLDDGGMWPTSFALKALTAADEAKITAMVKKAVG